MNCRKCGARHLYKNSLKQYSCRHCGVQPHLQRFDRFGNVLPTAPNLEAQNETLPE